VRKAGAFRTAVKALLDGSIHAARSLTLAHEGALAAYERLLSQVRSQSALLRPSDRAKDNRNHINAALLALAIHHQDWLRPPETWWPATGKLWPQFSSLAHHLFARYPVPNFMSSVWFDTEPWKRLPQHEWYKQMGLGKNIRTVSLPLRFTKAMSHLFSQAPDHFTVFAALRWAQVRGLGGNEELARAVVITRLGRAFRNEDFWEMVLHFFISHPRLDLVHVGPIVDFLQAQKFATTDGVSAEGVFGKRPPPQPDYTMKGRTVASILRQVEEWHRQLGQEATEPDLSWSRSRFKEYRMVEGCEILQNMRVWTITELLTSRELFLEGQAMRHCVASYAGQCAKKQTSIWSMQVENRQGRHRVLTIEVDLTKKVIRQARKKLNRLPQGVEREVLKHWATQEGLSLVESLRL
jgi:hypothetical protein